MRKLSLLAVFLAAPAFAHVTLETQTAESGGYYKAVLRVGHGCDGSPTTAISVEVPEGVQAAHPMPKAGWQLNMEKGAVAPYDYYGKMVSEDVKRISWSGGALPNEQYDEFVFRARIGAKPGTLYFKVRQQCQNGETNWSQIPAQGQSLHDLKTPAAVLKVLPAGEHQH